MKLYVKHKLSEWKREFFRSFAVKQKIPHDGIITGLLQSIKQTLGAKEVSYFQRSRLNGHFIFNASSNPPGVEGFSCISKIRISESFHGSRLYGQEIPEDLAAPDLIIPLWENEELDGLLVLCEENSGDLLFEDEEIYVFLSEEVSYILAAVQHFFRICAEEKKYKQLFRVTEKFHSSMNMEDVLSEVITSLQEVYPSFEYHLMLSHDTNSRGDLPVKDLDYNGENDKAMEAFVSGELQLGRLPNVENESVLYAPLLGKQGVYGVLQVIAPQSDMFPREEVEFITLLANTAGSAIENAQLYQQSKRLIADLQLINETSHRLNKNLRMSETLSFMRKQISTSFQAQEIGFVMYMDGNEATLLSGSTAFFEEREAKYYIQYLKDRLEAENDALFIGDLQLKREGKERFRSIMAVPMMESDSFNGFAIVMHRNPYHFTFEMFKLLQSLIHHSTLAFTNSLLRERLEKMVVTDHLTRLFSRNYLDQKLLEAHDQKEEGIFILMDIDNFKSINDTYGHQIGDEVLVQVSDIVLNNIRGTDIGARWGGEELAIYLPKVTLEMGKTIAERIRKIVEDRTNPRVSLSCGVSYWIHGRDTVGDLFNRADTALYIAKNSGKNRVVVQK